MGGWGWGALPQAEARGSCVYSKVTGRTQVTTGPGRGDVVGAGGYCSGVRAWGTALLQVLMERVRQEEAGQTSNTSMYYTHPATYFSEAI